MNLLLSIRVSKNFNGYWLYTLPNMDLHFILFGRDCMLVATAGTTEFGNLVEVQVRYRPFDVFDIVVVNFEVNSLISSQVNPPFIRIIDIFRVLICCAHAIYFHIFVEDPWVFYYENL